jgi:hypothetical protein
MSGGRRLQIVCQYPWVLFPCHRHCQTFAASRHRRVPRNYLLMKDQSAYSIETQAPADRLFQKMYHRESRPWVLHGYWAPMEAQRAATLALGVMKHRLAGLDFHSHIYCYMDRALVHVVVRVICDDVASWSSLSSRYMLSTHESPCLLLCGLTSMPCRLQSRTVTRQVGLLSPVCEEQIRVSLKQVCGYGMPFAARPGPLAVNPKTHAESHVLSGGEIV